MPKKCCVPNCKVQQDDTEGLNLSFYKIPVDENIRNKWLNNIKRYFNIELKRYSYVCSRHFEDSCLEFSSTVKNDRLKKGSCPTNFVDMKNLKQQNKAKIKEVVNNENMNISNCSYNAVNFSNNIVINNKLKHILPETEESTNNQCDSDKSFGAQDIIAVSDRRVKMVASTQNGETSNVKNETSISNNGGTLDLLSSDEASLSDYGDPLSDTHAIKSNDDSEKSINANIDLSAVQYTAANISTLKRLLLNGQNEIYLYEGK